MDNTAKALIEDGVIVCKEKNYREIDRSEYMEEFMEKHTEGKILSDYEDETWVCFSGVLKTHIDFAFSEVAYKAHFGKTFPMSKGEMTDALKCYVLQICNGFIFKGMRRRIQGIIAFLTEYGNADFKVLYPLNVEILDFLSFLGVSDAEIDTYARSIRFHDYGKSNQRELCPMINYMVIADELDDIYNDPGLSDDEFIAWFPLYFWAHITFILPLRATEMIVTPYDCFEYRKRSDGYTEVWLKVRRTRLKKVTKVVHNEITKDYEEFSYLVYKYHDEPPKAVAVIEKYRELTKGNVRNELFAYTDKHSNDIYSTQSFNRLLRSFVMDRLIGSHKYDYAKFASGIKEFEIPTIGDSRPIAMANIFFQDCGSEICRQLADHENLDASYHYYSNVSKTVYASSILHMQWHINEKIKSIESADDYYRNSELASTDVCTSPKKPQKTGDISDCIKNGVLGPDCIGCEYYHPTNDALDADLKKCKERLDTASKSVLDAVRRKTKKKDVDIDKLFLDAQTGSARYRAVCDANAEEKFKVWQRYKGTATNN